MYTYMYIAYYILPIDCPLLALEDICSAVMDMGSDRGPGPRSLLIYGPYPIWLNICASRASNRQYIYATIQLHATPSLIKMRTLDRHVNQK